MNRFVLLVLMAASWALSSPCRAEVDEALLSLSLEELLNTRVESVSKRDQSLLTTPASVYVLDADDIEQSGATRLQELLALVPGVYVGDVSYELPATTIRDLPEAETSTILVLIDRVPVHDPSAGGFVYTGFDIDISEIERIEVIKGPGATVYGTNAATGVISIYTKNPAPDESTEAKLQVASNQYFAPSIAVTRELDPKHRVRSWLKFVTHSGYSDEAFDGDEILAYSPILKTKVPIENRYNFDDDDSQNFTFGLSHAYQMDEVSRIENRLLLSQFSGDRVARFQQIYPDDPGEIIPSEAISHPNQRSFLVASTRYLRPGAKHDVFGTLSVMHHDSEAGVLGGVRTHIVLADVELQDRFRVHPRHVLSYGGNARLIHSNWDPVYERSWLRPADNENTDLLYSVFLQSKTDVRSNLQLLVGVKAETWTLVSNQPEILPSVRASFQPTSRMALWGGFSRSITTPSYFESAYETRLEQLPPAWALLAAGVPEDQIPAGAGHWITAIPSDDVRPTEYWTTELGLRSILASRWSLDVSSFYSKTDGRRRAVAPDLNQLVPSTAVEGELVIPIAFANAVDLESHGVELVCRYQTSLSRFVELSYSYIDVTALSGPAGTPLEDLLAEAPNHTFRVRGHAALPGRIGLSASARWTSEDERVSPYDYVEQVPKSEDLGGVVLDDQNTRWILDLRLNRRIAGGIDFAIWGKNLLNDPYVEDFPDFDIFPHPKAVERTFGVEVQVGR